MLISHFILAQIKESDPKLYEEIIQEYNQKYESLLNSKPVSSDTIMDSVNSNDDKG